MPILTLTLPTPHKAQRVLLRNAARYNAAACGRRWGKSTLCVELAARPTLEGLPVGWFAPNYKLLTESWRVVTNTLAPVISRRSKQERRVELITGGVVEFWTLEDPDAGRSRKYRRIIVDEAGLVRDLETQWQEAIRPTLTDYAGDAWFLGTPKGRNFFWACYERGQQPDSGWNSWCFPTVSNPHIDAAEVAAAKDELPAVVFAQEYEAAFTEDATTLFRATDIAGAAIGATGDQEPQPGKRYLGMADLGRRQDATVINVFDTEATPIQRVYHERLERVPFPIIQQAIERTATRYPGRFFVESNGIGDPVIENLTVPVRRFVTTARSKVQALQALQVLLEQGRLKARWTPQEHRELTAMTWDDRHLQQDCVMSLAIGAANVSTGGLGIAFG